MAAGLGFKDFVTGEVLTAADVDGYLMQGVWVFASAAARDAAVTAPQEGNFAYLKDTNVTTYYTGSAWANLDTTGMTNPMTTTGDTIYSSSGSTPARLGIGTTGQVLTVAGGVPSWATPAGGGGITQIQSISASNQATVQFTSIPGTYKNIYIVIRNFKSATGGASVKCRFNSDSGANRHQKVNFNDGAGSSYTFNATEAEISPSVNDTTANGGFYLTIPDYANTTQTKWLQFASFPTNGTTNTNFTYNAGHAYYNQTGAITSFEFFCNVGNITSGTFILYGVN
jgi:hypothetical protein